MTNDEYSLRRTKIRRRNGFYGLLDMWVGIGRIHQDDVVGCCAAAIDGHKARNRHRMHPPLLGKLGVVEVVLDNAADVRALLHEICLDRPS